MVSQCYECPQPRLPGARRQHVCLSPPLCLDAPIVRDRASACGMPNCLSYVPGQPGSVSTRAPNGDVVEVSPSAGGRASLMDLLHDGASIVGSATGGMSIFGSIAGRSCGDLTLPLLSSQRHRLHEEGSGDLRPGWEGGEPPACLVHQLRMPGVGNEEINPTSGIENVYDNPMAAISPETCKALQQPDTGATDNTNQLFGRLLEPVPERMGSEGCAEANTQWCRVPALAFRGLGSRLGPRPHISTAAAVHDERSDAAPKILPNPGARAMCSDSRLSGTGDGSSSSSSMLQRGFHVEARAQPQGPQAPVGHCCSSDIDHTSSQPPTVEQPAGSDARGTPSNPRREITQQDQPGHMPLAPGPLNRLGIQQPIPPQDTLFMGPLPPQPPLQPWQLEGALCRHAEHGARGSIWGQLQPPACREPNPEMCTEESRRGGPTMCPVQFSTGLQRLADTSASLQANSINTQECYGAEQVGLTTLENILFSRPLLLAARGSSACNADSAVGGGCASNPKRVCDDTYIMGSLPASFSTALSTGAAARAELGAELLAQMQQHVGLVSQLHDFRRCQHGMLLGGPVQDSEQGLGTQPFPDSFIAVPTEEVNPGPSVPALRTLATPPATRVVEMHSWMRCNEMSAIRDPAAQPDAAPPGPIVTPMVHVAEDEAATFMGTLSVTRGSKQPFFHLSTVLVEEPLPSVEPSVVQPPEPDICRSRLLTAKTTMDLKAGATTTLDSTLGGETLSSPFGTATCSRHGFPFWASSVPARLHQASTGCGNSTNSWPSGWVGEGSSVCPGSGKLAAAKVEKAPAATELEAEAATATALQASLSREDSVSGSNRRGISWRLILGGCFRS